jgi:hypothetical protein
VGVLLCISSSVCDESILLPKNFNALQKLSDPQDKIKLRNHLFVVHLHSSAGIGNYDQQIAMGIRRNCVYLSAFET